MGNYVKYLKGSGTERRGGERKILKRGQGGLRGGCTKNGGWNLLTIYDIYTKVLFWEGEIEGIT